MSPGIRGESRILVRIDNYRIVMVYRVLNKKINNLIYILN
jgi:hypothetical protein